jgi:SAM-dependent methyltransferase
MRTPANWFQEWFNSPYYHKLYVDRDEKEAADFIERLLNYLQPAPGSLMLDVACGRGRHAKILAGKGFDVTGIDIAPDSIAFALRSETDKLHFYEHDMRMPFWINYFDYAFNFFTSFGYFKTDREHSNTIRSISQSMKNNGVFVLDYLNVQYAEDHLVHKSVKQIEGTIFHLTKWFDEKHFYKKINIEEDGLQTNLSFTEKVARFTLDDFEKMFAQHGLNIYEVFGDYELKGYDTEKSPRLIMIAKKEK